jgi:hypothetical protein
VHEPTYEGLCKLLALSRPSLGIFSAEGGQSMGGHGMAEDAKLRTAASLSALWDGDAIKRVRADETTILPDRGRSVHLMAQPEVAGGWLNDPLLADQGLLSRVLVSGAGQHSGNAFLARMDGQRCAGRVRPQDLRPDPPAAAARPGRRRCPSAGAHVLAARPPGVRGAEIDGQRWRDILRSSRSVQRTFATFAALPPRFFDFAEETDLQPGELKGLREA